MSKGLFVRVNPLVEEVVKELAKRLRLTRSAVRNLAILYGIERIAHEGVDVWCDEEFFERLERIKRVLEDGKRWEGEEGGKKDCEEEES